MSGLTGYRKIGRSTLMVAVSSYGNRTPAGTLCSIDDLTTGCAFSNFPELLFGIEKLTDESDGPQRSEEPRGYFSVGGGTSAGGGGTYIAMFRLMMLFRQHATWQGMLIWEEKGLEARFRSALELIRFIDTALMSIGEAAP